jgi:predicted acylesterase/phospholipase RssA
MIGHDFMGHSKRQCLIYINLFLKRYFFRAIAARLVFSVLVAAAAAGTLQSCATAPRREAYTASEGQIAQIPGIPLARFWGDELPPNLGQNLALYTEQINQRETLVKSNNFISLAISGGGANGAYGAGLLVGWTAAGNRPSFTIVTGISTGSLIAPFAFLGPQYDAKLKYFYTSVNTENILQRRSLFSILTADSVTSTAPLRQLIAKVYDQQMLDEIAAEWHKGRRLFVGTTNLDAERPVIWRLGAIAASGHPRALSLMHDILLASASIPGVFPPVYIEVAGGGQRFTEMHVDGGVTSQVFLYPASFDFRRISKKLGLTGQHQLYVIRNSTIRPNWEFVEAKLFPITTRSISSLIRTQGIGDLYRIYLGAMRDGMEYNLAYIPSDIDLSPAEGFDPVYMAELFELGYQRARKGYPWQKAPPGFEPPRADQQ